MVPYIWIPSHLPTIIFTKVIIINTYISIMISTIIIVSEAQLVYLFICIISSHNMPQLRPSERNNKQDRMRDGDSVHVGRHSLKGEINNRNMR